MIIKRVKNIFFGNSWLTTFSSVFFINCIQLIQTKYFAVNFDKHSIGMFSIFLATVSIVQLIGESGISTAVIRREKLDAVFINNAIALNSVFFVLIWIVSLFFFEIIKGYLNITTNLLFFNLIFLLSYFQYLYGLFYSIAINQDLVNGIGKIELLSKLVGFCSILFFVNYFSPLNTIFLVFTIPLILQIVMIAKIINKKIQFKLTKIDLIPFFIQNKGFIVFLTMDRVFNSIASWLDNYIIGYKFGASNLANYSLLRQISQKPSAILSSVFNRVMYAEMIKVRYDKFLLTTIYLKNIRIIVVLNMLFVLLFYCFSEQIIIILL